MSWMSPKELSEKVAQIDRDKAKTTALRHLSGLATSWDYDGENMVGQLGDADAQELLEAIIACVLQRLEAGKS